MKLKTSLLTLIQIAHLSKVYCSTMQAALLKKFGGPKELYIGDAPMPVLGDQDILIKVYATALNRADCLQRKGFYPPPPGSSDILGLEAAGTVEKVGAQATKWKLGQRVMALLGGGGNAEFAAVHEDHVLPVPDSMSFSQAAAVPEVWLTAYQIINTVGKYEVGDSVLIHAGGSGVGTAAVQLIKTSGGHPIVTAGSADKITMATSLGAETGFNYKEGKFDDKVMEFTNGKGVNMILDCVGGSFWEQNANVIAMEGRWVLYGALGGSRVEGDLLGKLLRKRASILATTLRTRSVQYKAALVEDFRKNALPLFESGKLKSIVDTVFPLTQIADAHRYMEENKNTGKIVIQVRPEDGHSEL